MARTTDGGAHWQQFSLLNGLPLSISIDPTVSSTLYAVTATSGVFKSTDGGLNWTAKNNELTAVYTSQLAIDRLAALAIDLD